MDQNSKIDIVGTESSVSLIDFKRILYWALRYWYMVVLSMVASLTIAFYNNRYTQRIYPVSASIIIREREETSGAELLYKNSLVDQYRNYLNEPYIIRSYALIERVVEDLNFQAAFYREGFVLTTETYHFLPVKLKTLSPVRGGTYIFNLLDEDHFSLEVSGGGKSDLRQFAIGDTISFQQNRIIVEKVRGASFDDHINTPYLLVISDPLKVTAVYVGKLNVSWAEEGSGVINLAINGPNPGKEIDFMNSLIMNYQKYDLEKKNQTADRTVEFIKGQLLKISDSLKLFEGQLQHFKKNNRASGDLSMEAERIFSKVESLEVQRAELKIKENYYEYLRTYINQSKNIDFIILPSSVGITDPVLTSLISNVVNIQMELKLYLDKKKKDNPLVTNEISRLGELKAEILSSLENLKSTDKIKLDFLNKQIADAEKQIGYLPLAERQLVSIQRNYSLLENLYVFLMQKMSEAEISKASATSDIEVVNPPMLAGGSITPKTYQNYIIATFAGLSLPILIFILLELLNTRVQSREDIEKITSIPFIGGIGHKRSDFNLEVLKYPKSSISESFRPFVPTLLILWGKRRMLFS